MKATESLLPLTVERGYAYREGQTWASIKLGEATIFSALVFDNEKTPAEENIVNLFASRLARLLEDE